MQLDQRRIASVFRIDCCASADFRCHGAVVDVAKGSAQFTWQKRVQDAVGKTVVVEAARDGCAANQRKLRDNRGETHFDRDRRQALSVQLDMRPAWCTMFDGIKGICNFAPYSASGWKD
ncbi:MULTISPECIES: hypothetical protein [Alphaproteobacteria]|uniref:hypothetical protein n=1 Tax=Alphaproteobacteria TaxID=28211 RepID=UPI003264ECA9